MKLLAICALLLSPLAFADPASKNAKIEQLFQAMNIEQQQKEMMAQMQQMISTQVKSQLSSQEDRAKAEEMQKKLFALITSEISLDKMMPVMVKAYAETYTEAEIDGILAFYKSAAGKAMVDKQPKLMSVIMTGMQDQMTSIMTKIENLIKGQ